MQLNPLVLSYVASAAVAGAVAIAAWRRRHLVGARELALVMLSVGWWLLANACEASALDRSTKIAWSRSFEWALSMVTKGIAVRSTSAGSSICG